MDGTMAMFIGQILMTIIVVISVWVALQKIDQAKEELDEKVRKCVADLENYCNARKDVFTALAQKMVEESDIATTRAITQLSRDVMKLGEHQATEGFIDSVVERINRKQLKQ